MISLSSTDQTRLGEAFRAVLSPLEHADVDQWRRVVCRNLKELLGADMASFILPTSGALRIFSEDFSPEQINAYPDRLDSLDPRVAGWKEQVAQAVWSRGALYHSHWDTYVSSAYYNEYIVPMRCFDSIGITIAPGGTAESEHLAGLMFHHEKEAGLTFGERGQALLRLLLPVFRAGVDTQARWTNRCADLSRTLDTLSEGVLLYDTSGRVIHRNRALESMLSGDPQATVLRAEIERVVHRMREILLPSQPCGTRSAESAAPLVREVRTGRATYRICGSSPGPDLAGSGAAILISLEKTRPDVPSQAVLRDRFRLTRAQAGVALLMAEGKSNAIIAEELFLSVHTVRRHAETIRGKLGVRSRAEVASTILRG